MTPLLLKNTFGHYLLVNHQVARIFNTKAEQIIGKDDRDFFPPEIASTIMKNDALVIEQKKGMVFDETILSKGKKSTYLATKTPLKSESGKVTGIVVISRDITERKKLEAQKDDFIGVASHELKTPVTSIKAYIQLLRRRFDKQGDNASAELIAKVDTQLEKLSHLITDLLDVSRLEKRASLLDKSTFSYPEMIKEVVGELRLAHPHRLIELEMIKRCRIHADKVRLARVLSNIVGNALKYSPESRTVTVTVRIEKGMVVTAVEDHGLGIHEDKLDQIFDRFYRITSKQRETYPGLGLGLYISKQIINLHGGSIWATSSPGKGSVFTFTLPLKTE
jgi:PAS domain S-box-containing protein